MGDVLWRSRRVGALTMAVALSEVVLFAEENFCSNFLNVL